MNTTIKWIIGIIVVVLVIWGIGTSIDKKDQVSGPVKIGVVLPLTGGAASIGETAKDIIEIAAKEVNDSGGINGYDMEFVFEDGACDGATAANATQKLVNVDKLKIISGIICSGEAFASIPIVDQANAFMLAMTPTSPKLTGISKNFARMFASDAGQAGALAEYANKNFKKIGILNEETDYAIGNKDFFVNSYTGEEVVESFSSDTRDIRTNLSKIKAQGVDALLVIVQTPATVDIVLNQLSTSGFDGGIMIDVVIATSPDIVNKYVGLLKDSISAQVVLEDSDRLNKLREEYKQKRNQDIQYEAYMMAIYDSVHLLADAINSAGTDPDDIAKFVYNVKDRDGLSGKISIDENGDRVGGYILQKFDGEKWNNI